MASSGRSLYAYQEKESFPRLVGSWRTAKSYLSISEMLSSAKCAILAAGNVLRSAGHFPSSAAVEGKSCCRLCTCEKGRPALSPRINIPCSCLYGLIRSRLHARGWCELSSASAEFMSLPSGGRSERGPHIGIPLDTFHSATSVGLPPSLERSAESVTLDSSYDPVRLHTPICLQLSLWFYILSLSCIVNVHIVFHCLCLSSTER